VLKTLWIVPVFVVGAAALIAFNVVVLELGDSKFDKSLETACGFYLPIWLVLYSPHILTGWLVLSLGVRGTPRQHLAVSAYALMVLIALQMSFVADGDLVDLGVEWIALAALSWVARRLLKKLESRDPAGASR
jgi:hypothetical protein